VYLENKKKEEEDKLCLKQVQRMISFFFASCTKAVVVVWFE
jgi:hypothetical protein